MATQVSFSKELFSTLAQPICFIAILTLALSVAPVFAQTVPEEKERTENLRAQQVSTNSPRDRVKIIVRDNQLVLIGSLDDVKIVKAAYELIRDKMKVASDPVVSEKVVLKFQMADVVVAMMNSSMDSTVTGSSVKAEALHFPESVLLIGPSSSIRQAKKLLKTIDSYSLGKQKKKTGPAKSSPEKRVY